ncbi:hypothetical protein HYH02_010056 [Chlamydomonas schloesseri]|uniref:Uncharacterized protein n=1 Tax=Chlamydomonas schloesseri TaxID=2026947 RepID=A0A835TCM9_9CHLO|nr:hypothetical protein HYH02_010056 [Chlamydomonas schloesseri]|eukprot:KAG2441212.1 hypothetical protein HYH02_010056 [Chlamydomonas schloesseri]
MKIAEATPLAAKAPSQAGPLTQAAARGHTQARTSAAAAVTAGPGRTRDASNLSAGAASGPMTAATHKRSRAADLAAAALSPPEAQAQAPGRGSGGAAAAAQVEAACAGGRESKRRRVAAVAGSFPGGSDTRGAAGAAAAAAAGVGPAAAAAAVVAPPVPYGGRSDLGPYRRTETYRPGGGPGLQLPAAAAAAPQPLIMDPQLGEAYGPLRVLHVGGVLRADEVVACGIDMRWRHPSGRMFSGTYRLLLDDCSLMPEGSSIAAEAAYEQAVLEARDSRLLTPLAGMGFIEVCGVVPPDMSDQRDRNSAGEDQNSAGDTKQRKDKAAMQAKKEKKAELLRRSLPAFFAVLGDYMEAMARSIGCLCGKCGAPTAIEFNGKDIAAVVLGVNKGDLQFGEQLWEDLPDALRAILPASTKLSPPARPGEPCLYRSSPATEHRCSWVLIVLRAAGPVAVAQVAVAVLKRAPPHLSRGRQAQLELEWPDRLPHVPRMKLQPQARTLQQRRMAPQAQQGRRLATTTDARLPPTRRMLCLAVVAAAPALRAAAAVRRSRIPKSRWLCAGGVPVSPGAGLRPPPPLPGRGLQRQLRLRRHSL